MSNLKELLEDILDRIRKMSPEEFAESLVRAGIIDEHGKLTERYRRAPRES